MSLPTAQPAEVLRAWQKDDFYEKHLAGQLSKILTPKFASNCDPASSVLYRSLTTLKDLQTLGEEYSGIVQVDDSYHKLPLFRYRLLSILLSIFGENITKRLIREAEKKVESSTVLRTEAQNTFLIILKALNNMVPQIQTVHRALCYISGGPIQIGKTMSGIDYVQVRPAAMAYYAHLRLLGIVTLLHAIISCGKSAYDAKKHIDQIKELNTDVDNTKACVACLEEMLQPCILPCGHVFCINCSYGVIETCALCRTPFTKFNIVPLVNYYPGDSIL